MEYVEWQQDMSVGNVILDEQHQYFIKLVEEISKSSPVNLPLFLKEVIKYTNYHFDSEEELLKEIGYPYLEEHIQQHEALVAKVASLFGSLQQGNLDIEEVKETLNTWVIEHIYKEDQKYKDYLVDA